MSTMPSVEREGPADIVAGFLAALAIVGGLIAIAFRPVPIGVFSILVALVAAGMSGRHERLAASAVAVAAVGFLAGMIVAVLTNHALW
ncbi:MAG TPA: hypothetical protein VHI55_10300 [Gaiellaceae bacterium]|nr:hypothetical protein [Gaiellaceae bacterium]